MTLKAQWLAVLCCESEVARLNSKSALKGVRAVTLSRGRCA
jgi:hypothetical protein